MLRQVVAEHPERAPKKEDRRGGLLSMLFISNAAISSSVLVVLSASSPGHLLW